MVVKVLELFGSAGASGITKDLEIPQGSTILIKSIDFSGPSFTGIGSKVIIDPDGEPMVIGSASGDKFISLPSTGIQVVGSGSLGVDAKKLRIELKKIGPGSAVDLGCIVIYEEL